jgi:hypothetical protein
MQTGTTFMQFRVAAGKTRPSRQAMTAHRPSTDRCVEVHIYRSDCYCILPWPWEVTFKAVRRGTVVWVHPRSGRQKRVYICSTTTVIPQSQSSSVLRVSWDQHAVGVSAGFPFQLSKQVTEFRVLLCDSYYTGGHSIAILIGFAW